ncbi:MAG: hypothetical protein ACU0CO_17705 [Shimia sp.]
MTDIPIPEGERGAVRVFALSLDRARARALAAAAKADDAGPLAEMLGLETVDARGIDVFPVSDLEGVGLPEYLVTGMGVAADEVRPDRPRLTALGGFVMVVRSKAHPDARMLRTDPALTLVGRYQEEGVEWTPLRLEAEGARPSTPEGAPAAKPRKSDARMSGMVATAVLLFLGLFVVAFVWIGG